MLSQLLAIAIFLAMFTLIILDKAPRHIITLSCAAVTLFLVFGLCMHSAEAAEEALSLSSIFQPEFWYNAGEATTSTGINWETIFFIAGMMIMVEGMAESGFFRWLCITIARAVHFRARPVFLAFMVMAAALSMFIDSITVIMFLAAVTVELAQLLELNPVPMILAEIFCSNLGGSATMCGDPPNIIIGTSLGCTFFDFISNTGLMALVSLAFMLVYFCVFYRREVVDSPRIGELSAACPLPRDAIVSRRGFVLSCCIFLAAVVLLVTHAQTHLTVSCIGVFIGVATLAGNYKNALRILKQTDFRTLLFFIGLFVVISGLEETGVLDLISSLIAGAAGGHTFLLAVIILWGSAVASAFIDNIPFAATMIPVIRSLSAAEGIPLSTLAWALSLGTDIGGNATPIGASANVVGTSIAAKSGHPINWRTYCRSMAPATVLVTLIDTLLLYVRYF